jgi:hypothetical protein
MSMAAVFVRSLPSYTILNDGAGGGRRLPADLRRRSGRKWDGLDRTISALAAGGLLVVDDMTVQPSWNDEQAARQKQVGDTLLRHPALSAVELDCSSGNC